jgi:hypothetical protein
MANNDKRISINNVAGGGIGPDLLESYFTYKDGKYKFFDKDNREKSPRGGVAKGGDFAFHLDELPSIEWILTIDTTSTENLVTGNWYEAPHRVKDGLPVNDRRPVKPPEGDQTYTAQSSGVEEHKKNAVSAKA